MTEDATTRRARPTSGLGRKLIWIGAFYFSSGFPFGLLQDLIPVYFRTHGVDLAAIGLLTLLQTPYTFKFLWSPLVDWLGTRRQWILACQVAIAALVFGIVLQSPGSVGPVVWGLLLALAVFSATQDVAVDAFTIEQLDQREYGLANGLRVTAYRAAMIVVGGVLLTLGGTAGWGLSFTVAAAAMLALAAVTFVVAPGTRRVERPRVESDAAAGATAGGLAERLVAPVWLPLRALAAERGPVLLAAALVFVLTFKIGDLALIPMIRPFWVDSGYSPEQIGLVLVSIGMGATILGALAGGVLTARLGTFRALWMLGLVQALSNLGYYVAATTGAAPPVMYGAAVIENFTSGLGTAAFLTFLMDLCDRRFAATQYALLSALYRVGGIVAGSISGFIARDIGYASYFLLTFVLTFPAFLLLPAILRVERARAERTRDA